jgi:hypothetical protein
MVNRTERGPMGHTKGNTPRRGRCNTGTYGIGLFAAVANPSTGIPIARRKFSDRHYPAQALSAPTFSRDRDSMSRVAGDGPSIAIPTNLPAPKGDRKGYTRTPLGRSPSPHARGDA